VIRGYWDAEIYKAPGKKLTDVSIPSQKQGEGITFTADGRSLLVSSEGANQPLWKVPVPASALPPKAKSATPSDQSGKGNAGAPTSGSKKISVTAVVVVAGVIVLIAALFARRRGS
jgi:hypothetical protein